MWKSLFTIAICMSLATGANASSSKKINLSLNCFGTKQVASVLDKHKEEYTFMGIDEMLGVKDLVTILFLNKETKTYTIVFTSKDSDLACIVSSGNEGVLLIKARD